MSCVLSKGRENPCNDNVAGVKNIYLAVFVYYDNSLIVGIPGVEIREFPLTTFYKYDVSNANFSQNITNDENGNSVSQSLTFTLLKQDLLTNNELSTAKNIDLRYIVEYNNGNIVLGGTRNGATIESIALESGGAKNELNGYRVSIEGQEEYQAEYIDSVDFSSGDFFIFQDGDNFIFQNGNNYIFN